MGGIVFCIVDLDVLVGLDILDILDFLVALGGLGCFRWFDSVCVGLLWIGLCYIYSMFIVYLSYIYCIFIVCYRYGEGWVLRQFS